MSVDSLASKYVEKAVHRLKNMSREDLEKGNRSVLEHLLLNTDDPSKGIAMAMDMLMAGVDSVRTRFCAFAVFSTAILYTYVSNSCFQTSAVMSTVLYQLAKNPEKQAKLQEELDRVIPDKDKPITKDQMEQLK